MIQSGASSVTDDHRALQSRVAGDTGLPPKLVWDLLDIETDPEKRLRRTWACVMMEYTHIFDRQSEAEAWIGSEEMLQGVLASTSTLGHIAPEHDLNDGYKVPPARLRRLRDALVELGVRKDMDWAALDNL